MSGDKYKDLNDVITYFNRQVAQIFKFIDSNNEYQDNALLHKVRLLVKITKSVEPTSMIERCVDKMWDHREAIIARDVEFFKSSDTIKSYIKEDDNKEWLTGLTDFIMDQYDCFDDDEMAEIWSRINNMLEAIIKYRLLTDT